MPDRYVKAQIYWIWHGRLTDYDNPQPVSFEETDFDVQVENRKATFTFKKEFETEEQAREAVWHYINILITHSAPLRLGPRESAPARAQIDGGSRDEMNWKSIAAVVVTLGAILSAGLYVGELLSRLRTVETWQEQHDRGKLGEGSSIDDKVERTFSNTAGWGQWSDIVSCPPGYYVCGMKQSVEPNQGGDEDDTAMNGLIFYSF